MAVRRYLAIGIIGLLTLSACSPAGAPPIGNSSPPTSPSEPASTSTPPPATTTAAPREQLRDPTGSYAVLVFTNHLPAFGRTADGSADRPWARLHTARDYISIVRLIAETQAQVVLSYSPVLLEQIADVAAGHPDQAAVITAKPANELTATDKAYINDVFFIASPAHVDRYPRYRELVVRRDQGRPLSTNDYRDLQVLFNLAWTSPLLLEDESLADLAGKGRGFTEADKRVLLDGHQAAASEFLTTLRSLRAGGVIEVATTPLANPSLPVLVRNRMDQDATDQIRLGAARASAVLGADPRGMTPAGGLIDQANGPAALTAGFEWLLLSETETSRPFQITSEEGSLLALPNTPDPGRRIADTYFAIDPDAAAGDMVRAMADAVGDDPGAIATFAVDGTEPWGRYDDGGMAFLRRLLQQLSATDAFAMALPSELSEALRFDPAPYPNLPDTYLRGRDELVAWALLADTRRELARRSASGTVDAAVLDLAQEQILQAQGADWYRWYDPERDSGEDRYYDETFRSGLTEVWSLIGSAAPDEFYVPLHRWDPVPATHLNRPVAAAITIDNSILESEWSQAGTFDERTSDLIRRVHYTFDEAHLFVRVDFAAEVLGDSAPGFDLYLRGPMAPGWALTPLRNPIGFEAALVAKWRGTRPVQIAVVHPYGSARSGGEETEVAGFDGNSIEFEFDLATIAPSIQAGDRIDFRIFDVTGGPEIGRFPTEAAGSFEFPNLEEGIELASLIDRARDDYGPGTYTYVVDSETPAGAYDLAGLDVRLAGGLSVADPEVAGAVQFKVTFRRPLTNPWSAPAGFSLQTVDLYLDTGTAAGAQRLLPGRVAATEADSSWDYAFTVDGWEGSQYVVDPAGAVTRLDSPLDYTLLADMRTILVTVPRSELPAGDETTWRFGVAVAANQAIPTLGIHGLRALARDPGRFRLGGSTGAANDPMIIDLLHPDAGVQEAALTYPEPVLGGEAELAVDDLARLPMLAG
jgi:alpha-amylase/alpha-mannosidase (GH57 family)